MVKIPDNVVNAINNVKNPKILATVDADGNPHAIQAGSITAPSNEMMIAAAILMKRTGKNLESMKRDNKIASFLVLDGMSAYEVRCKVGDFVTSGSLFDMVSERITQMGMKLQGVWTFEPIDIFNESASAEAGTKMV
ncbi:MAG: hypothetical protein ACXV5H_09855 [Halobacteriota archaeon]